MKSSKKRNIIRQYKLGITDADELARINNTSYSYVYTCLSYFFYEEGMGNYRKLRKKNQAKNEPYHEDEMQYGKTDVSYSFEEVKHEYNISDKPPTMFAVSRAN